MNKFLTTALFLSALVNVSFAKTEVTKLEVYPPYIKASCSELGVDAAGKIALQLNKISVSEKDNTLSLTVDSTLKLCTVATNSNGKKELSFKDVNPFIGYDVQYFDSAKNDLALRHDYISKNVAANRFETVVYVESSDIAVKTANNQIKANSMINNLEVSKLNLLNQNDIDVLNSGKELRKVVSLFHILNVTSEANGVKYQNGDITFDGRNVVLTFAKVKESFKVRNISVK